MAKLYRKSLLEKLQSPDQLDKMVKITPPSFWVAIAGGVLIIIVTLVWSLVGTIPEKLDTNGVYLYDQNTYTISSEVNGIVEDVNVEVGEEVVEGEVLYSFDSDSLEEELKSVQERLEKVQKITLTSKNDEANQDTQNLLSYKAQYISGSNNSSTAGYKVALEKYEEAEEAEAEAKKKAEDAYKAYTAAAAKVDSSKDISYSQQLKELETLIAAFEAEDIYYQNCIDLWNIYNSSDDINTDWNFSAKRSDTVASYTAAVSAASTTGRTITKCHTDLLDENNNYSLISNAVQSNTEVYKITVKITPTNNNTTYTLSFSMQGSSKSSVTNNLSPSNTLVISELIDDLEKDSNIDIVKAVISKGTTKTLLVSESDYSTYYLPFTDGTSLTINAETTYDISLYGTLASYKRYDVQNNLTSAQSNYATLKNSMSADVEYSSNDILTSLKSAYDSAVSDYQSKAQLTASAKSSLASYEASDASSESSALASAKAYSTQFIAAKGSLVDQLEKEIEKYQKQIDANTVTATMDGIVTNLAVSKGSAVSQGTSTVVIRQKKDDQQVVLYVSLSDGKKIEEGMKVNVYPTTVNKSEYGHMIGTVTHVADYITTDQEIFNKVGDKSLASMFTQNGSVLEVICELEEDDSSVNGYAWSTEKGKTVSLKESTIVSAEVITDEQHPISILIPFLKDQLENLTKEESK